MAWNDRGILAATLGHTRRSWTDAPSDPAPAAPVYLRRTTYRGPALGLEHPGEGPPSNLPTAR
ncbi:hypothetical protein H9623_05090 [Oerskovia sp. Sa1BUA8]|uniref:Uncharacterized protein n=1 Tax=Oerskovia douganii TaxID=2762210 RepID=A0A9D5YXZ8_9CELL|nr:hypothetical protein [Oerskovia douganii]MBE7699685.1 hypothetical protein [Oerskovia douganii]